MAFLPVNDEVEDTGRGRDETLEGWQRERDGRDKEEGWFEGWETEEQQQQQQQGGVRGQKEVKEEEDAAKKGDGGWISPYWRLDENAKYNLQSQDAASLRSNVGKKQCSHHGSNPFARYPAILSSPTYLYLSFPPLPPPPTPV